MDQKIKTLTPDEFQGQLKLMGVTDEFRNTCMVLLNKYYELEQLNTTLSTVTLLFKNLIYEESRRLNQKDFTFDMEHLLRTLSDVNIELEPQVNDEGKQNGKIKAIIKDNNTQTSSIISD